MKSAILLLALAGAGALAAAPLYELPDERPITLPAGADSELAEAVCSACHSLDYLTTQPPALGAKHWADTVDKMVRVHGAELAPEDRAAITAYLGTAMP